MKRTVTNMKNATNNGYTRCRKCQTVYEDSKQSCPCCGESNTSQKIVENSNFIHESVEPVFNILD